MRWTDRHQWHVTLAFLGDVPERRLDDLTEALTRSAARRDPLVLRLAGAGAFPNPYAARVLWAGVEQVRGDLATVARGIRSSASSVGATPDGTRFHPHVTLGRFARPTEATRWIRALDALGGPGLGGRPRRARRVAPRRGARAAPALRGASPSCRSAADTGTGRCRSVWETAVVARGDGRLGHDLLPGEKGPQDACGVFGVWAPGEDVAKLTYFGLYALQHRGQESAGIATGDGEKILVYKDMGLVSQVFDETALSSLRGHIAIGHTRYSTTGGSTWENAQPTLGGTGHSTIALAHNGNLINTVELKALVDEHFGGGRVTGELARGNTSDTALVTTLLAADEDRTPEQAALELLPKLKGAFSFVFMDEQTLYAARDPWGVRPLALGRLERGWVVASETAALQTIGASVIREVEPGELIAIDENGLRSHTFAEPQPKGCVFEYVYLARPDAVIRGRVVHEARVEMGRVLAREHAVDADLVIGVPESGVPAAVGLFAGVGHPLRPGLRQERLRRPHLHPAVADAAPARHPAQAQPARAHDPRQAPRRRRRLDRARQHPARADPDAARVRGGRGARAHQLAARAVAVLLRHRLRDAGRAHRDRAQGRGDPGLDRRRLARLHLRGGHDRRDQPGARPALLRLLHRALPDRAARGRPHRQARARDPAADGAHRPRPLGRRRRRHASGSASAAATPSSTPDPPALVACPRVELYSAVASARPKSDSSGSWAPEGRTKCSRWGGRGREARAGRVAG